MAFDLYLMGHGCYRPKNGYFSLPKNYSMQFYTEHGNSLPEKDLQPILRGTKESVRSFNAFASVPNYTWINGEVQNWNFYVVGEGPDLRTRKGLSPRMGKNSHLALNRRNIDWDVRYVQYFKTLAAMQKTEEFTLKMLFENSKAQAYFLGKSTPINIHVLLCSNVEMNSSWR